MSPLGTFSPGVFWPEGLLAWGIFVREGFSGGSFARGTISPGRLLSGGIFFREGFCPGGGAFVRGAYARSPPSSMRIRTV